MIPRGKIALTLALALLKQRRAIVSAMACEPDEKADLVYLQILDYEHLDSELRHCFDLMDDDDIDSKTMELVARLATRNGGRDNANQEWVIARAEQLLSEELTFAAGLLEALFTKSVCHRPNSRTCICDSPCFLHCLFAGTRTRLARIRSGRR